MANLKTIQSHISEIRTRLRQTSDDSIFSDLYIYKKLLDCRAMLLKQRIDKGNKVSIYAVQKLCYELEISEYNDCHCLTVTEDKCHKTKNTVPDVISNKYADIINITSLDGTVSIDHATPSEVRMFQYSKTKSNKAFWDYQNGNIAIFGYPASAKSIYINAVFYDPLRAVENSQCPVSAVDLSFGLNCNPNPEVVEFPLNPDLNDTLYDLVLSKLTPMFKIPEDRTNNSESALTPVTK